MKSSAKIAIVVAAIAVAIAIAIYFVSATKPAGVAPVAGAPLVPAGAANVPTIDFLKSHPEALAEAQKSCDAGSGQDVVTLCDAVHSAKASLLADKFRQGASGASK